PATPTIFPYTTLFRSHPKPEYIIVDGNRFKPCSDIPYSTIVKGDGKYLSIAAASVLAKTYRDDFMEKIHKEFPMYNWKKNKGYRSEEHTSELQSRENL